MPKLKAFFLHSRTILAARIVWLAGAVTMLESTFVAAGLDWTPLLMRLYATVPADLRPLAISATVTAAGAGFEYLRRITTGPLAP